MKAQFYYEWGNEPAGYVSTGYYDKNDVYHSAGLMKMETALKLRLFFNNPHA